MEKTNWYLITKDNQLIPGEVILISIDGGFSGDVYGIFRVNLPTIVLHPQHTISAEGEIILFPDQSLKTKSVNADFRSSCYLLDVEPNSNAFVDIDSKTAKSIADSLKKGK